MFDFCFKIIIKGKIYLKIFKIINKKNEAQLQKFLKDKIVIFLLEYKFGKIDYISFGFIISYDFFKNRTDDIIKGQNDFKTIKNYYIKNGYNLFIYDINESILFSEKNNRLEEYIKCKRIKKYKYN